MKKGGRQYLVIGLGRFGSSIARTLCSDGMQVMAVDRRMDVVEDLRDVLTQVVQADATDHGAMQALGAGEFDVAIVTMGGDIKASCVATMLLKELGVRYIVAKAADDFHGRMLEKLGADKIVFPERDMGKRVAHNLVSGNLLEYLELSPDFSMAEIQPNPEWIGKTLVQLRLRDQFGVNVVAIRSGDVTNALPKSDTVLHEGDMMLVVAGEKTLLKLNRRR